MESPTYQQFCDRVDVVPRLELEGAGEATEFGRLLAGLEVNDVQLARVLVEDEAVGLHGTPESVAFSLSRVSPGNL